MESMEREWNEEYEALVKESISRGEITLIGDNEEKRVSPRFRIKSGAIWVRMDTCFDVLDASISGIALLWIIAAFPMPPRVFWTASICLAVPRAAPRSESRAA